MSDTDSAAASADAALSPGGGSPPFAPAGATDPPGQPTFTMLAMPPSIAKAVIKVMSEVKKLGKEGSNTFQRYKFTSVDQFYEALGPLMASHGLMDIALERSVSIDLREVADDRGTVKKSAWLTAVFDFWLFHESGASYGPITRHIQVQATGAQSYASAQSYAEKYFLRNLFKVPTGDVDEIDSSQQVGLPAVPTDPQIDADQLAQIQELLAETKSNVGVFFLTLGCVGFSDMTVPQYRKGIALLNEKKRRMALAAP